MAIAEVTVANNAVSVTVEGASLLSPLVAAATTAAATATTQAGIATTKATEADASADLAADTLTTSMALGYNVTGAFTTYALMTASSLVNGDTSVVFADANPGNNIKSKKVAGSWVDGLPLAQARYQYERGTVTAGANTLAGVIELNSVWNSGANNDGTMFGIRLNIDPQSLTNFNPGSKFIDLRMNSVSRFDVTGEGYMTLRNAAATSVGGMRVRGSAGEMDLTSQLDGGSGLPAPVMSYYWESTVGEAAVLRGRGTNRFSIESDAALVHIASNGRFEWEGLVSDRLLWVGYEAGSAIGKTIDFNNAGQTPTRASPVVSVSVTNTADDALHVCTLSGTTYTPLVKFMGTAAVFVKNASATPSTPTGGGVIYIESGALKYKGSSGTVTTLAAA